MAKRSVKFEWDNFIVGAYTGIGVLLGLLFGLVLYPNESVTPITSIIYTVYGLSTISAIVFLIIMAIFIDRDDGISIFVARMSTGIWIGNVLTIIVIGLTASSMPPGDYSSQVSWFAQLFR